MEDLREKQEDRSFKKTIMYVVMAIIVGFFIVGNAGNLYDGGLGEGSYSESGEDGSNNENSGGRGLSGEEMFEMMEDGYVLSLESLTDYKTPHVEVTFTNIVLKENDINGISIFADMLVENKGEGAFELSPQQVSHHAFIGHQPREVGEDKGIDSFVMPGAVRDFTNIEIKFDYKMRNDFIELGKDEPMVYRLGFGQDNDQPKTLYRDMEFEYVFKREG